MTTRILFVLAAVFLILTLLLARVLKPRPRLEPDIIARSRRYIDSLGSKPIGELNREQKLLLLHSYYNVRDYDAAAKIGEAVTAELQSLPPERQALFREMIEDAYRKSGQEEILKIKVMASGDIYADDAKVDLQKLMLVLDQLKIQMARCGITASAERTRLRPLPCK